MSEREMRVETPDGAMRVFAVHPDGGGPYPVAVLYMDGVGYREQIKRNARRFAAAGYYCVAPDLYHRVGEDLEIDASRMASGGLPDEMRQRMMAAVQTVTPERMVSDTRAVFAAIDGDPAAASGPRVCVGYCLGARVALHVASTLGTDFAAAAGIHPGALVTDQPDSPHHDLAGVRGELYIAFSENDRFPTEAMAERLREEMGRHGVRGTVERMPGTSHGFAMADLPVYDETAAERHFERTLDLWRRNLGGSRAS